MYLIQGVFRGVLAGVLGLSLCVPAASAYAVPVDDETQDGIEDVLDLGASSGLDEGVKPDDEEGVKVPSVSGDNGDEGSKDNLLPGSQPDESGTSSGNEKDPDGTSKEDLELTVCPILEGVYLIQPAMSSLRVLDVSGGSRSDGANIQIWESNMSGAQRFEVVVDADGYATIVNVQSGKVLDVAGAQARPGTTVWQYAYNNTKAQKWRIVENADGTYSLESALANNLVLDVYAATDANGSKMQVYAGNGSKAQKFTFINAAPVVEGGRTVADGVYEVASVLADGKNLDISSASTADGAGVQIYASNHTFAQRFVIKLESDEFYSVKALHSGKSLDVDGGNLLPGAKVHQWASGATPNQRWAIRENVDGTITFICKANAQVLDVRWGSVSNGTPLQSYVDNGSLAQKWSLKSVNSILDEGYYCFRSALGSSRSLDITNGSVDAGANVQLWSWNGSAAQRFKLSMTEIDGVFTLETLCSGRLLTQKGNNVIQSSADIANPDSQQWRAVPSGAGGIVLVNVGSNLALDVYGAGDWNGNNIGVYTQNNTVAQAFRAEKVDVIGEGTFVARSSGGCVLDVAGGSRANGANVQAYMGNNTGAQKWKLRSVGNGFYSIENARSKKALDIAEKSTTSGANVQQWDAAGSSNQLWRIEYVGDGYYSFVSASGDLSLNIEGGGFTNGQNATVRNSDGALNQRFRLEATTYIPEDFTDCLASFSTYSTNTIAGTYNMQRALNSFNGYIIWPGQTMSFFGVAGPCGAAQGYLPAGIVGGIGYGGGICQASTTLYGAFIRSGLAIVERRNHSVPSTYVPIGLDAMVDYGSSDFKVRNDFGYPVKIVTDTPGSSLNVSVYGIQPEWYDYIEPQSWWTGDRSAAAQRTFYKNGAAVYVEALRNSYY